MISVCQRGLISIIFLFWSLTARGDGVMGRNVDKSSVFASWHRSPFNRTKVHYLHYYKLHRSICQSFSLLFPCMLMNRTLRYLPWVVTSTWVCGCNAPQVWMYSMINILPTNSDEVSTNSRWIHWSSRCISQVSFQVIAGFLFPVS